jgi:hypothetical protein
MFDIGSGLTEAKEFAFTRRMEKLLSEAVSGTSAPTVYVHVITSLSDGMGSKIFPKICYRIRYALRDTADAHVLGYFFLPNVDMAKLPFVMDKMKVRIMAEGYAGMQRLDTFMAIDLHGGSYEQTVRTDTVPKKTRDTDAQEEDGEPEDKQDGGEDVLFVRTGENTVEWKCPPLDWCYFASAEDERGMLIARGYEFALNSVAEHVMDYMVGDINGVTLKSVLQDHIRFAKKASAIDQEVHRYSSLSNSAMIVPFREINTALATELWSRFAQRETREPTEREVFHFIGEILNDSHIEELLDEADERERKNAERDAKILKEAGFSMEEAVPAFLEEFGKSADYEKESAEKNAKDLWIDDDDELSEAEEKEEPEEEKLSSGDGREGYWDKSATMMEEQAQIQDELSHLEYEKVEFLQELESIHKETKHHEIYERLYLDLFGELTSSVGIPGKYPYDVKYAVEHPESVTEFFDQQSYRLIGNLDDGEAKIFSYSSESPLIRKMRKRMQQLVGEFTCGTAYVRSMLDPSFAYNIEKVLDGILEINEEHIFEYHYGERIQREFDEARRDFENGTRRSFGDSNKKRLRDYLEAGEKLLVLTIYGEELASITKAIGRLREELRELGGFFGKLDEIVGVIDHTFEMNRNLFETTDVIGDGNPCGVSIIGRKEIDQIVEAAFRTVKHEDLFEDFMQLLVDHPEEWMDNDQDKICWLVNNFVCATFKEYANMHMEDHFHTMYHTTDVKMIESAINIDFFPSILAKARVQTVFDFRSDPKKAANKFRYKEQRISLPAPMRDVSEVYREACAKREKNKSRALKEKWSVREKDMWDRVYVQDADVAIPISSLCHMGAYEVAYRFMKQIR